jgi:hypothetical protein
MMSISGPDPDDEDLEEFVRGQRGDGRIHPVRVVLAVAATVCAAWVLVPTVDELAYHLSRQSHPVDIGDARAEALADVTDGTWVRADVILGNKAAEIPALRPGSLRFGPILVREVVGAPLVVEYDATHLGQRLLPFNEVAVEGRLVTFAVDRGELQDVAQWFERELRVKTSAAGRAIIVDEKPRQMGLYLGAWIAGLAAVVFSWGGILRRLRPR